MPWFRSPSVHALLVVALLGSHVCLSALAAWGDAATYDETAHLTAGRTHLSGDFRLNPEHPPLVKALAGIGPALLAVPDVPETLPTWQRAHLFPDAGILVGYAYLYARPEEVDATRTLFSGRVVMIFLSVLLGLALYWTARRMAGPLAGLVALVLWAFEPTGLAHGHLVTNDVAMALIGLVLALAAVWLARMPTWPRHVGFGLLMGVGLLTKFTAILWIALIWAGLVVQFLAQRPWAKPTSSTSSVTADSSRRLWLWQRVVGTALALLVAWGVIWAGYGFRFAASDDPAVQLPVSAIATHALNSKRLAGLQSVIIGNSALFAHENRLLPEAFIFGICYASNKSRLRRTYLLGHVSDRADWRFFPLSILTKLPLALLLLMGVGLFALPHALQTRWRLTIVAVGGSALALVVLATVGRLAIGIRHILPALPALLLLAAAGTVWLVRRGRRFAALAAALLLWHGAAAVTNHPHHIAYFNELAGGPAEGGDWFVDSNLDWGQELGRLGQWMRANDVKWVNLAYFGTDEPRRHGVVGPRLDVGSPYPLQFDRLRRPGVLAISETARRGLELDDAGRRRVATWLAGAEEIGHIGGAIRLYVVR
ncbi:MAG: glycosyltransferase family 39 protein [Myxococcales bacterium]|nr:glycosyltransferase family 39 protein [Myxococcales bacterium]